MRTTYFTLLLIFLSLSQLAAQRPERNGRMSEENREKIEAAFIAHITNRLNLNSEQAQQFWPVYNEFKAKKDALEQERRSLRRAIHHNETEDAEKTLKQMFLLREQELSLQKQYFSKEFKQILSADQRLQLYGAEEEFKRMLLRRLRKSRDR